MVRFHHGSPAKNKASLLGGFAFGVPGSRFQVPGTALPYAPLFVIQETYKSHDIDEWIRDHTATPPLCGARGVKGINRDPSLVLFPLEMFRRIVWKDGPFPDLIDLLLGLEVLYVLVGKDQRNPPSIRGKAPSRCI
jgi:hypothetical protein